MMGRIAALTLAVAAALSPALPARAEEVCGPLKIVNIIHMMPTLSGDADIIPIAIGGKPRNFLLDTGGYYSQISRKLAKELNLSILQSEQQLFDAAGNISRDQTRVRELTLGEITDKDVALMISSSLGVADTNGLDGILALDRLAKYDAELDFSTDTLNLFSPDHCPGHVVYWNAPAMAAVPISLQRTQIPSDRRAPDMRGLNIYIPVMLDGHEVKALIDTGATNTSLRMDEAERLYGLSIGSTDTPAAGTLNGNAALKIYSHKFQKLSFGDVSISDVRLSIIPNAMGRNADHTPLVGDRTKSERDLINEPEMLLGMDVLRRLHLYIAFGEKKLYISPASAPPAGAMVRPYTKEFISAMLQRLDTIVAASPEDADALNDRCFWRAIASQNLDGALSDCDKSLRLNPGDAATLDSRAFVLFQQGKYQEALAGYDAALAVEPHLAPSLMMRGLSKGKLGDLPGQDADIAAARADDPTILAQFERIGIVP